MSDGFDWQQIAALTGLLTAATAVSMGHGPQAAALIYHPRRCGG